MQKKLSFDKITHKQKRSINKSDKVFVLKIRRKLDIELIFKYVTQYNNTPLGY